MMKHMVRLHLDHKPHWNSLHLPVSLTYSHRTIPRVWHAFQELKDMVPVGLEKGQ
jgi:hypothetical protein